MRLAGVATAIYVGCALLGILFTLYGLVGVTEVFVPGLLLLAISGFGLVRRRGRQKSN